MVDSTKLSIIIPAYNAEATVRSTLSSVLPLLHEGAECIVVDDGSEDGTLDVVQHLQGQHPNFRSFSQPNQGLSAARNAGLRYASREWITFLDSDDLIVPSGIRAALRAATETRLPIVKSRLIRAPRAPSDVQRDVGSFLRERVTSTSSRRSVESWLLSGWGGLLGGVFNRALLDRLHPAFQEVPFAEDLVFTYALATLERSYVEVSAVGYVYTVGRVGQMTDAESELRLRLTEAFYLCEQIAQGQTARLRCLLWTLIARYRFSPAHHVGARLRPAYRRMLEAYFNGLRERLEISIPQLASYLLSLPAVVRS